MLGANIPAIIRGLIAVAWYGIQTYLASAALVLLALKLWPGLAPYAESTQHGFAGLSLLGWIGFGIMWVAAGRACSGAAWSRSASSSTSAVPRCTW